MRRFVTGCAALCAIVALVGVVGSLAFADEPVAKALTAAPVYTCPMHPQVQWPQAASCPLCGMALKLKTAVQTAPAATGAAEPMTMDHDSHGAMDMGSCPNCMQMPGMSGMVPVAPAAGGKIMAPASMRMSGGRGCGC
jgi:hypothetical protein